jgi:uncharacterized protein (DUF1778 family)
MKLIKSFCGGPGGSFFKKRPLAAGGNKSNFMAAEITHKSITEFVLDSACQAAANALLDQRLFLVDDEAWQKFQDALDEPAKVKPKLRKLIEEKAPWE